MTLSNILTLIICLFHFNIVVYTHVMSLLPFSYSIFNCMEKINFFLSVPIIFYNLNIVLHCGFFFISITYCLSPLFFTSHPFYVAFIIYVNHYQEPKVVRLSFWVTKRWTMTKTSGCTSTPNSPIPSLDLMCLAKPWSSTIL